MSKKRHKCAWTKTHNLFLRFVRVTIHCELKGKNNIYKPQKVDDRIPILQLDPGAKNKNKAEIKIKEDGFKTGIRLKIRLKDSRNML